MRERDSVGKGSLEQRRSDGIHLGEGIGHERASSITFPQLQGYGLDAWIGVIGTRKGRIASVRIACDILKDIQARSWLEFGKFWKIVVVTKCLQESGFCVMRIDFSHWGVDSDDLELMILMNSAVVNRLCSSWNRFTIVQEAKNWIRADTNQFF
ncbi:hypothetical protein PIB30_075377 [Stylosanthes scabra]|uniref:Uncharacterized protein n=1 Tax=Stylosanthes scabra TaxID=79078 RepID=A0ABU6SQN5_9FABA|nr:hypothetical protein [Stylosanthes scabra]